MEGLSISIDKTIFYCFFLGEAEVSHSGIIPSSENLRTFYTKATGKRTNENVNLLLTQKSNLCGVQSKEVKNMKMQKRKWTALLCCGVLLLSPGNAVKGMEGSLPDTGRKKVLAPEKAGSDVKENTKEIQRQQEE